jgi:tRNA pseudouridine13 synthase
MKLKQRPEDFVVREAWRFDEDPRGPYRIYLMDKQKLSTFEAMDRICQRFRIPPAAVSFCGLKDKQGRTEQLIAVRGRDVDLQEPDLRLKPLGRAAEPLSAKNLTANRFAVTVRDLGDEDLARLASSVAEVQRLGLVNYFDSQRFGAVKHGQGFIAKDLVKGQFEHALHNYLAKPSPLDRTDDAKVKAFWAEHWGEWQLRCPYKAVAKYRAILSHLRENPDDWVGAFLQIEPRYRALLLFEYQSYLWNEGVKELLRDVLGTEGLISLPYQAGRLLFPREAPPEVVRDLRGRTFPLLAADSPLEDPVTRKAVHAALRRERIGLPELALSRTPGLFFKHEERQLLVVPGKLVVSEPRRDEMNSGRRKVNIAFTLPPGAYATLLVKRLFWFSVLEGEAEERGEFHPTAARVLESAFGPQASPERRRRKVAPWRSAPGEAAVAPDDDNEADAPVPARGAGKVKVKARWPRGEGVDKADRGRPRRAAAVPAPGDLAPALVAGQVRSSDSGGPAAPAAATAEGPREPATKVGFREAQRQKKAAKAQARQEAAQRRGGGRGRK